MNPRRMQGGGRRTVSILYKSAAVGVSYTRMAKFSCPLLADAAILLLVQQLAAFGPVSAGPRRQ